MKTKILTAIVEKDKNKIWLRVEKPNSKFAIAVADSRTMELASKKLIKMLTDTGPKNTSYWLEYVYDFTDFFWKHPYMLKNERFIELCEINVSRLKQLANFGSKSFYATPQEYEKIRIGFDLFRKELNKYVL